MLDTAIEPEPSAGRLGGSPRSLLDSVMEALSQPRSRSELHILVNRNRSTASFHEPGTITPSMRSVCDPASLMNKHLPNTSWKITKTRAYCSDPSSQQNIVPADFGNNFHTHGVLSREGKNRMNSAHLLP